MLGLIREPAPKSPGMACVEGIYRGDQQLERLVRTMSGGLFTAAASMFINSLGSYFILDKVPEVLQDYPALLLYTVLKFRAHVHLAARPGSRLKEDITEICQGATFWARFVALNEYMV